jgi:hypothetical protein
MTPISGVPFPREAALSRYTPTNEEQAAIRLQNEDVFPHKNSGGENNLFEVAPRE